MSASQYPHHGPYGGLYPFSNPPGLMDLNYVVLPESTLKEVLERACGERGLLGMEATHWVNSLMQKFGDVGVDSARDFVEKSWSVNHQLNVCGQESLPHDTIRLLLRLCCDVIYERGVKYGSARVHEHYRFTKAASAVKK